MSERTMIGRRGAAIVLGLLAAVTLGSCERHEAPARGATGAAGTAANLGAQSSALGVGGTASAAAVAPAPVDPSRDTTTQALRQAHELVARLQEEERRGSAPSAPPAAHSNLLGSFTLEDVSRAAGGGADGSLRWRASEWRAQKDSIVALAFHPVEFGGRLDALGARLVVLQKREGELGLVAERKLELSHAECANESGEEPGGDDRAPDLTLDLAPYVVASGQTAIGVRFTCAQTYPAAEGLATRLYLFELHEGALRPIFDEQIASTSFDRVSGNTTTVSGLVTVQRQAHDGHFDLQLRLKRKTEGSDPESFPNTARQPSERTETKHFVWNGEHYAALTDH